jgi:hypothetical protein
VRWSGFIHRPHTIAHFIIDEVAVAFKLSRGRSIDIQSEWQILRGWLAGWRQLPSTFFKICIWPHDQLGDVINANPPPSQFLGRSDTDEGVFPPPLQETITLLKSPQNFRAFRRIRKKRSTINERNKDIPGSRISDS